MLSAVVSMRRGITQVPANFTQRFRLRLRLRLSITEKPAPLPTPERVMWYASGLKVLAHHLGMNPGRRVCVCSIPHCNQMLNIQSTSLPCYILGHVTPNTGQNDKLGGSA